MTQCMLLSVNKLLVHGVHTCSYMLEDRSIQTYKSQLEYCEINQNANEGINVQ